MFPSLKKHHVSFVLAVVLSMLLLSVATGTHFVNLGLANPFMEGGNVPPDENTKPPRILILSPKNNTMYNVNNVLLDFHATVGESTSASYKELYAVYYKADWQQNQSAYLKPAWDSRYIINLSRIPDGNHSITVYAREIGWYIRKTEYPNVLARNMFEIVGSSAVFFTVDTIPPSVSVLSLENKTYYTTDVALNFTVNEPVSQITYSLDRKANVTIAGNTTLSGLSYGSHSLTIYANDTAGNTGASETIYFSITQQEPFTTWIAAAATAITVVAVAPIAGYLLLKRKKSATPTETSITESKG
jgi:hypothetical protein